MSADKSDKFTGSSGEADATLRQNRRLGSMRIYPFLAPLMAGFLASCALDKPAIQAGSPVGSVPYVAVQKAVPDGENRIYLTAALPGRIMMTDDCVLFERLDGEIVLPVFENGVATGRDNNGAWLYDPVSEQYFRHQTKIIAGGGGGGETISELYRRNVLQHTVPDRCTSALTEDAALMFNPGLNAVDRDR